ncbi:MAG: hypothetical protein U1D55_08790 [Phycisphaerae bacterium]
MSIDAIVGSFVQTRIGQVQLAAAGRLLRSADLTGTGAALESVKKLADAASHSFDAATEQLAHEIATLDAYA